MQAESPSRPLTSDGARPASRGGSSVVDLVDLRKRYNVGLPNETEVLRGISLRVARGEFVALIGP